MKKHLFHKRIFPDHWNKPDALSVTKMPFLLKPLRNTLRIILMPTVVQIRKISTDINISISNTWQSMCYGKKALKNLLNSDSLREVL